MLVVDGLEHLVDRGCHHTELVVALPVEAAAVRDALAEGLQGIDQPRQRIEHGVALHQEEGQDEEHADPGYQQAQPCQREIRQRVARDAKA